ncbi:unnamed protein product [Symbiodinium microadriaticum]|nr:unnamed protein product [Symbiodinium microadriaticum]
MVIGYCAALATFPDYWWTCTLCFGLPFSYIAIQNIYIDHDVMHGATFPVYEWQRFLTHPFADFVSLPWEEFVLEHNRHHASTVDLLIQGEFGWDPEEFHYALQQWAGPWGSNWYKYLLTVPFIPVIHFFGLNDTGSLFALEWWMHFPDEGAGGKCNKELPGSIRLVADQSYRFWSKWIPRRIKHNAFVLSLWACIWLLGTYPLGRPLSEGWRFMFTVSFFARIGYSAAWMFITNFTHSLPWNEFLAQDPGRTWPVLHNVMAMVLGGKHRWNEMLFHDATQLFWNLTVGYTGHLASAFAVKASVHDAAAEVLHRGLWKPNGDEETQMQKTQKKRSMMMQQGKCEVSGEAQRPQLLGCVRLGYSGGGTGGSSSRHALKAKPSLTGNQDSSSPALSPSSQALGVGVTGQSGRSIPVMPSAGPQYRDAEMQSEKWSTDFGRIVGSPKGGARVASFVRLNGFLLRTHITSLLSALAEDGWLEAWEKERLCSSARDAESRWAQSFLQIYMRFVETDDVATFVAGLKAQERRVMTRCRSARGGGALADVVGLRCVLLLLPLLFTRSLAGFPASKNSIKLAASTGTLSPQNLAEPAEVDLLEDADSPKEVPFALPRVQAAAPEKLDSEVGVLPLLASDRTWTVISFVVGYAIVQYFLSFSDKASGCEAVKTD